MHAGLFNVLHDATNEGFAFRVANAVYVALNGVVQETIEQHGRVVADLHRFAHVALKVALLVHNFHGTTAQHVAGANHQGVTQGSGFFQSFGFGSGCRVGRLTQTQLMQQFLETFTVFSCVNHVGAGTNDGHTSGF